MPSVDRATSHQVIGTTRLIQITSAAFGALLVPFHTVTLLPIEAPLGNARFEQYFSFIRMKVLCLRP